MVQFIIRITGSLALLGGAVYIHQSLPNTEFYNYLVIALLAFFVGEGPIYGVEKSTDRIEDEIYNNSSNRKVAVILAIGAHGTAVLAGCIFLILGCVTLIR